MNADPLLGSEVGRWRIERLIGIGGMGRVYLGVRPEIDGRVAIKVLSEECARDEELVDRFVGEAKVANLIHHENVVNVVDHSRLDDGRPYLVMEYIDGVTLGDLAQRGPQPLDLVVPIVTEVLRALGAAHAHGVIHRDLKPGNVLVTREHHAKVLDFGIAKRPALVLDAKSPRTRSGAVLGTPAYMSPEQIRPDGKLDGRADLYAVGVMLYEALTGKLPFSELGVYDMMDAHLHRKVPSVCALRPDVPAALERVIERAMAKRPGDRYQTADDMLAALQFATSPRATAPTLPAIPHKPAAPRRRWFLMLAAFAAFTCGASGTSLALHGCDVPLDDAAVAVSAAAASAGTPLRVRSDR